MKYVTITCVIDTEHHDIDELLLNLALNTNQSTVNTEAIIRSEHLGSSRINSKHRGDYKKRAPRFIPVFYGRMLLIVLVFCVVLCFYVLFVFIQYIVCPMLPVSLDCPLLFAPSVFSNIYICTRVSSQNTVYT